MDTELIRNKLSDIVERTDEFKSLRSRSETELLTEIHNTIEKIRMNTIACLIETSKSNNITELSPDEELLVDEYEPNLMADGECESPDSNESTEETYDVGRTPDGFFFLK